MRNTNFETNFTAIPKNRRVLDVLGDRTGAEGQAACQLSALQRLSSNSNSHFPCLLYSCPVSLRQGYTYLVDV